MRRKDKNKEEESFEISSPAARSSRTTTAAFSARPAPPQEPIQSAEVFPNGFAEVYGWMCSRLQALTSVDLQRYALNLVSQGFNSVGLLKEMLDPPLLAKCLQDTRGNALSQEHIHFKYIFKQFTKEKGMDEFS